MLQKYPPEPGLDFGVAVVGVWELFTDGREQVVRPLQAFLFRDPQHVGKVALGGRPSCLRARSEEHTSELQSRGHLVCRLLLEKKKKNQHASHRLRSKN